MNGIIQQKLKRRRIVQAGAAGAIGMAFGALSAREAQARSRRPWRPRSADYGPVSPRVDESTGLELLSLPDGFRYMSYGWTGQIMADGRPTPTDHDGMAVVDRRGSLIALVRNHELSAGEGPQAYVERAMYNPGEYGGTTNLFFNVQTGKFVTSYTSLGGTIRNCAGGLTPWNSWITCEETFHDWNNRDDGFNHGYIFDVPGFGVGTGTPIRAAGRFSHEAVAVDPATGIVYETEDAGSSALYKYVQPGAGHGFRRFGHRQRALRDGGELYAMVVDGVGRLDLTGGFENGAKFSVSWELVADPEGMSGRALDSAPNAAIFSRGEGAWYDKGKIYFVSTDGGALGLGQIWVYDPRREELTMLYESRASEDVDAPDNIAISPRGGIILCEDGDHEPQRLIGLTHDGETFDFAHNNVILAPGNIDKIDAAFPGTRENFWDDFEGDFTDVEWAGATFYGDWLFANIQSPGVTFAITGPWHRGAL